MISLALISRFDRKSQPIRLAGMAGPRRNALRYLMTNLLLKKGNLKFAKGHLTDALVFYRRALSVARRAENPRGVAAASGNMGNVYASMGKTEDALRCYRILLTAHKDLGNTRAIGITLVNMGNLHADRGDIRKARAHYLEAHDLLAELGDAESLAALHQNVGLIDRDEGDLDSAVRRFSEAARYAKRAGDDYRLAGIFSSIAKTRLLADDLTAAEDACLTSLAICERIGHELGRATALYHLAEVYERTGEKSRAVKTLTEVVRLDRRFGLPKLEENSRRLKALKSGPSA